MDGRQLYYGKSHPQDAYLFFRAVNMSSSFESTSVLIVWKHWQFPLTGATLLLSVAITYFRGILSQKSRSLFPSAVQGKRLKINKEINDGYINTSQDN